MRRCYCGHPDAAAATCRGCPLAGLLSPDLCFVAYSVTCAVMGHTLVAALKRHAGNWQTRAITIHIYIYIYIHISISMYILRVRAPRCHAQVCMYVCMYVCVYVCASRTRQTTTKWWCKFAQNLSTGANTQKFHVLHTCERDLERGRERWQSSRERLCSATTIYVSAYHDRRVCIPLHTRVLFTTHCIP